MRTKTPPQDAVDTSRSYLTQINGNKLKVDGRNKGVDAIYYQIDSYWGMKAYRSESMRDKCYQLQEYAALFDKGPAVGGKFTWEQDGTILYGFITEHAPISIKKKLLFEDQNSEYTSVYLRHEMDSIGITTGDMHYANIGWIGDEPVVIDYGLCYFNRKSATFEHERIEAEAWSWTDKDVKEERIMQGKHVTSSTPQTSSPWT